ncbi:MAG: AMP-binding protein [Eubacterium sp.]|jgi:Acyl-CoA synthetases (AMP-forming)/AMP-acid ligases II|nr:AMP-binding protein [Eubacterium sp.]
MIFSLEDKEADLPAIQSDDNVTVTYGELRDQAGCLKRIFKNRCLIFCLCKNTPGAVVGYIGALENRAVPLLLDVKLAEEQFLHFFHTYTPGYVWAPSDYAIPDLAQTKSGWKKVYQAYDYCMWETKMARAGQTLLHNELALLLATSGSTGIPKLVRISRENLESNAASIRKYLGITKEERPVTTLPMQYTYGLSVINSHLLAGACILMTESSVVRRQFWDFLKKLKGTSISGVPYTYQMLKKMHLFETNLMPSSLCTMTQAGGRLTAELQREIGEWAASRGIRFFVMYGQTEATARMSYLPAEDCLRKCGSIGIAIPGGRFTLEDEDGNYFDAPEKTGELIYFGENVAMGYAVCKEDLLLGDTCRGVLKTGDMARKDRDGYYYIVGRKKRFVKIFGVRIGLDECEQVLKERYPDSEAVCVGTDDHMKLYLTDRQSAEKAAGFLADYLHLHKKSIESFYLEEIPKNPYGKICYAELE